MKSPRSNSLITPRVINSSTERSIPIINADTDKEQNELNKRSIQKVLSIVHPSSCIEQFRYVSNILIMSNETSIQKLHESRTFFRHTRLHMRALSKKFRFFFLEFSRHRQPSSKQDDRQNRVKFVPSKVSASIDCDLDCDLRA